MIPIMAKKYYTLFLILPSFLLQSMATQPQQNCAFTRKWEIHVMNHLPVYSGEPLHLHCASRDNDLGNHSLSLFGDFTWSFCENAFGTTLFFCHLYWNSNRGPKNKAFDVFTEKWSPRCTSGICYWAANADGIHFTGFNPPNHWQKIYDWDNGTGLQEV